MIYVTLPTDLQIQVNITKNGSNINLTGSNIEKVSITATTNGSANIIVKDSTTVTFTNNTLNLDDLELIKLISGQLVLFVSIKYTDGSDYTVNYPTQYYIKNDSNSIEEVPLISKVQDEVISLSGTVATKANSAHTHVMADITDMSISTDKVESKDFRLVDEDGEDIAHLDLTNGDSVELMANTKNMSIKTDNGYGISIDAGGSSHLYATGALRFKSLGATSIDAQNGDVNLTSGVDGKVAIKCTQSGNEVNVTPSKIEVISNDIRIEGSTQEASIRMNYGDIKLRTNSNNSITVTDGEIKVVSPQIRWIEKRLNEDDEYEDYEHYFSDLFGGEVVSTSEQDVVITLLDTDRTYYLTNPRTLTINSGDVTSKTYIYFTTPSEGNIDDFILVDDNAKLNGDFKLKLSTDYALYIYNNIYTLQECGKYNPKTVLRYSDGTAETKTGTTLTTDDVITTKTLTRAIIGDNITSIGNQAFMNCKGLTRVKLSDGLTTIGKNAFASCSGLTSVVIPNSVTSIGEGAFFQCKRLNRVTIGNGVTTIGNSAFRGCDGLTSVVIPNSVTTINEYAFATDRCLTSVTIGSGVTTMSTSMFYECSGLRSVVIPNSVTTIGGFCFHLCSSLTSVTFGNSVTSTGIDAFSFCKGLRSITIPHSVTNIGAGTFNTCTSLTSITFQGTKSEWNAITKGESWHTSVPATVVHCTDGDVNI